MQADKRFLAGILTMPKIHPHRVGIQYIITALLIRLASARTFHSRDIHVARVITECENEIQPDDIPAGSTRYQAILGCILRTVPNYTTARWSAGASILAFIPTITAVMSNSIEEIVHIAEEDFILAIMMGLCSVTVFASRFGSNREFYVRTNDAIFEHIRFRMEKASKTAAKYRRSRRMTRHFIHGIAYFICLVACASAWFPTVVIIRNGVVVFSCPVRIHVPLWIGLSQSIVIANVLLRRFEFDRTIVVPPAPTSNPQTRSNPASNKQRRLSMRVSKANLTSRFIRGTTSTLTFSLYAFGTAVFGAMTMFTASDAVWCLVLFSFAAGMGRVVANFIFEDYLGCRQTIVVDVLEHQVDELKRRIEGIPP